MADRFDVCLPHQPAVGLPAFRGTLGRVTVLLGANGAGKSRTLNALGTSGAFDDRQIVRVEGGRVATIPVDVRGNHGVEPYATYEQARVQHASQQRSGFVSRLGSALTALEKKTGHDKAVHSDAVEAWRSAGSDGPAPTREEPALEVLWRRFSEVFPSIRLELTANNQIYARKSGAHYPVMQLSDGERQVLAILADIGMLAPRRSAIIVDEPELNLHPALAESLWTTLENDLPESLFVYASHSIQFAMRPSVEKVMMLGTGKEPVQLDSMRDIDPNTLRAFLGAVPGILTADRVLCVEGTEASFDKSFYTWLLRPHVAEVVPLGGCDEVRAAVSRIGIWNQLTSGVTLGGVMDRDFRSESKLQECTADRCVALKYHEAESYLCDPDLLVALAEKIGTVDPIPTRAVFETKLMQWAESKALEVAVQRATSGATLALGVSIPRKALAALQTASEIEKFLTDATTREREKLSSLMDSDFVVKRFRAEHARIENAIRQRNFEEVLKLFPGKELLASLAPSVGCKDAMHVLRGAKKHLDPAAHAPLSALGATLVSILDIGS
jgi:ABC-type branched-subunit amino acid transport system ATPase component